MKRNMSNLDRIVRVVLGGGLVAAGIAVGGVPAVVLYLVALVLRDRRRVVLPAVQAPRPRHVQALQDLRPGMI